MIDLIPTIDLMNELMRRNPDTIIVSVIQNEQGHNTVIRHTNTFHVSLGLLEVGRDLIMKLMHNAQSKDPFA